MRKTLMKKECGKRCLSLIQTQSQEVCRSSIQFIAIYISPLVMLIFVPFVFISFYYLVIYDRY